MTEAEWLACTDPRLMLEFLRDKASDRKLRLFAVACCRRIWHLLADARSRKAVEVAEQYADGWASDEQLRAVSREAASVGIGFGTQFSPANATHFAALPGRVFADRCGTFAARAVADFAEAAAQSSLLRCLWGNQLRGIALAPSLLAWHNGTVVKLAQGIYDERRFGDLPILADALEGAGCDNADVLAHCRSGGDHVRGCWVVDLLIGKALAAVRRGGPSSGPVLWWRPPFGPPPPMAARPTHPLR
jgi:hypothetical protein